MATAYMAPELPPIERAHRVTVVSPPPEAAEVTTKTSIKSFISRWQYHAGVVFSTGGVAAFLISSISSKWVLFEVAADPDGEGLSEERHARVIAHLGPWIACNQGNSCDEPWDVAPGLKEWTVRGVQFMFVLSILVNVVGISFILLRVTQPEWLPLLVRTYLTHGPIHCLIPIGAVLAFLAMLTMGELKRQVLLDYALDVKPGWALVVSLFAVVSTVTGIVLMLLSPSHTITPRRAKTSSPTAALFRRLGRRGDSAAPSGDLSLSAERVRVEISGKGAVGGGVGGGGSGDDGTRRPVSDSEGVGHCHGVDDRNENSSAAGGDVGGEGGKDRGNADNQRAGDCAVAASGRVFSFLCGPWEDGDTNDVDTYGYGDASGGDDTPAEHLKGRARNARDDLSSTGEQIHDSKRPQPTVAPSKVDQVQNVKGGIARPRPRPNKARLNQQQNCSSSPHALNASSVNEDIASRENGTQVGQGGVMPQKDFCQLQISQKASGEVDGDIIDLEENVDADDIPIVFKTGELSV